MWLIWQRLDPHGWKDGVSVRRLSAAVHCCEFIFPRQTFWHPSDSRKPKSFMFNCYIPTALWRCHPTGTQTYIFRREAMGCRFIPQPMAWSLFPCGRQNAESLHLLSCAPGAHLQAPSPDHAEGYGIRCPCRAAPGPIYLPIPFLFITWKAHRWERTS